jgi:hypothetical protein
MLIIHKINEFLYTIFPEENYFMTLTLKMWIGLG